MVSRAFTEKLDSFSTRFAVAREPPEERDRAISRDFVARITISNAERCLLISSKRREDGSRIRNDIAAVRRGAAETRARPFYRFNFHGERGSGRITIRAGKNESAEIRSAFRSTRSLRQSVGRPAEGGGGKLRRFLAIRIQLFQASSCAGLRTLPLLPVHRASVYFIKRQTNEKKKQKEKKKKSSFYAESSLSGISPRSPCHRSCAREKSSKRSGHC